MGLWGMHVSKPTLEGPRRTQSGATSVTTKGHHRAATKGHHRAGPAREVTTQPRPRAGLCQKLKPKPSPRAWAYRAGWWAKSRAGRRFVKTFFPF